MAGLLAAVSASACSDASSDPLMVVVTEETRSVLLVDANLPNLPRLAAEAVAEDRFAGAVGRWSRSWELPVERAREDRSQAYLEVSDPLARALGRQAVADGVVALGSTLALAESLEGREVDVAIAANLDEARLRHARAIAALEEGRNGEALAEALHASDLIREVGPEGVSRLLLARAEGALERLRDRGVNGEEEDVVRGQRLVRGAHLALEAGDYLRAVQRAFYACQLLGLDPLQ